MQINELYMHNFMSFHGEHRMRLDGRGLCLIVGYNMDATDSKNNGESLASNGSGKSAPSAAVLFCLYGSIERDSKYADDVINREAMDNCEVTLSMEDTKVGGIVVSRGRKPNFLRLYVNGEEITKATLDETQKEINKLLGMDQETFRNSFILSRSTVESFMSRVKSSRRNFIESLFGLQIFDSCLDKTRDMMREQSKIVSGLNINLDAHGNTLSRENVTLRELKEKHVVFLATFDMEVENAKRELKKLQAIDTATYDAKSREICDIELRVRDAATAIQSNTSAKNELDKSIRERKARILPSKCPTCNQDIADYDHYKKTENDAIDKMVKSRDVIVKKIADMVTSRNDMTIDTARLRKEMLDIMCADFRKNLPAKIATVQSKIDAFDRTKSPYAVAIKNCENTITSVTSEVEALKVQLATAQEHQSKLQVCEAVFGAAGVRQSYLVSIVDALNRNIESALQEISPKAPLQFEFDTDFKDTIGHYSTMSSGERRRVDTAIALAIMQLVLVNRPCNILFVDEIVDSLDNFGTESVIELLKSKCANMSSTFLITHNASVKSFFVEDDVITVVKSNNRSVIRGDKYLHGQKK